MDRRGRAPTLAVLLAVAGGLGLLGVVALAAAPTGQPLPRVLALVPAMVAGGAATLVLTRAATDARRPMHLFLATALGLQGLGIGLEALVGDPGVAFLASPAPIALYVLGRVLTAGALLLHPDLPRDARSIGRIGADAAFVTIAALAAAWAWYGEAWSAAAAPDLPLPGGQLALSGAAGLVLGVGLVAVSSLRGDDRGAHRLAIGGALLAASLAELGNAIAVVHPELAWLRLAIALTVVHPVLLAVVVAPAEEDREGAGAVRSMRWPLWIGASALALVVVVWVGRLLVDGAVEGVLAWLLLAAMLTGAFGYGLHRRVEARLLDGLFAQARDGEVALQGQTARFEAMIRHASDYVALVGRRGQLRYQSPSVEGILGHVPDVPAFGYLVHPDDRGEMQRLFEEARNNAPRSITGRLRVIHADGTYRVLEVLASDLSHDPHVDGIVLNARDVTERRELERRLSWRATHDTLTTLANRDLLVARLRKTVEEPADERPIVLFVDLDGFKTVNDTLGHSAGDDLLRVVAERLRASTRGADLVARLGGDEFAVLLTGTSTRQARTVARRIIEALREPVDLGGDEVLVHGSVGMAVAEEGLSVDDLLVRADLAMYDAKGAGGNRLSHFDPAMNADAAEKLDLTARLRDALATGGIEVLYQPVVDTRTRVVRSAEALARWRDPDLGYVSPGRFVPLAEETGMIIRLGRQVMDDAIRTLSRWHAEQPDTAGSIAVNVSARELSEPSFSAWISATLQAHGVEPERLTLEITERLLVAGEGAVLDNLTALRRVGVRVAVDDFGTGYSSLSMLDSLPADVLKIDRAFVTPLHPETAPASLAAVIEQLARTLHLETVAEGVETEVQAEALRRIGCTYLQGYLYHRPGTPEQLFAATRDQVRERAA